ncbi:3-deoxy-D-manno-octulosonic acid transferase [Cohaesibacter celericrescens]|uniref:3-deoxy-D-manno-octulosonic acid transferase n=1 Tax=Cohaesibacter celericrescens TaxID=2067669 RepID=A0A2N5XKP8_9HYPH|nr:3-deoxy-D-manno-octulosonic acid transferase [Cohaesibacter celericrescens]PLW75045.1 3-deoxy-D-manno-octulosonic acid transferase [Cohaesibacter celericrescens]
MDWSGRIALSAYRTAGYAFSPIAPLFLALRSTRGKEIAARRSERYGKTAQVRPSGPLVWVHASSVGETNAVLPLIEQIVETGSNVLLTTTTVTSSQVANSRLPKGAFHQFVPLDTPPFVNRFIDYWRPDLALFVESELWPNIMTELNRRDIPLIVVNGRMSERSFERWSKFPFAVRQMFGNVPLCLAQAEEDRARYAQLGVEQVEVTGNLKFDVPPPTADEQELQVMRTAIGDRPVWIAASTHPGEERLLAQAHRRMAARLPNLLTIIVPRHPERGEEIAKELNGFVRQVQRRSAGPGLDADTNILLGDTLGELGLFYRLSRIAFVGGSLVSHGGQNPIEPARLGCAILHGPHTHNFKDIYEALDASGGGECLNTERELIQTLARMISSPSEVHRRSELARLALRPFSGALDRTMMALNPFLNPLKINAELNRAHGGDNGTETP